MGRCSRMDSPRQLKSKKVMSMQTEGKASERLGLLLPMYFSRKMSCSLPK